MTLHIEEMDILERDGANTYFPFDPNKHQVFLDGERVTDQTMERMAQVAEKVGSPTGVEADHLPNRNPTICPIETRPFAQ